MSNEIVTNKETKMIGQKNEELKYIVHRDPEEFEIEIKEFPNMRMPSKGSKYSAGYDIYSVKEYKIPPLSRELISTDLYLSIPKGYYGRIAPRSGLAVKYGIDVLAGVVDSDYTGEIKVVLFNTDKNNEFSIKSGDKIAQLIIEPYLNVCFNPVKELSKTKRGSGGFGSTN